jgi:hypothetical protein
VVVLHDGTEPSIQDVAVARVGSIAEDRKAKHPRWYKRLQEGTHPTQLLIGSEPRHGTNGREAVVDGLHLALIPKATILRRTGILDDEEMRELSSRVITAFELDI